MIFDLDLYRNMKQGNRPQFKRQDTTSILTFFALGPSKRMNLIMKSSHGRKTK